MAQTPQSHCCVPKCTASIRRNLPGGCSTFAFPKDPERCKQWLRAIKNPQLPVTTPPENLRNTKVCSRHFKVDEFERDVLRHRLMGSARKVPARLSPTAVPSINLDDGEPDEPPQAQRTRTQVVIISSYSNFQPWPHPKHALCSILS